MACTIDFRCLDEGLGGQNSHKRKRSTENDDGGVLSMEIDDVPTSKRSAVPSADDPDRPTFGKPTYDGVIAGKVSGRKWKQPRRERASSVKVSHKGTTFEQRARTKEIKKAYKERMNELKEEIKANKVEKRKRREEREKRKKENILRSGTKLQKITNPKTLKKIAKSKQKKLLKVVPDDLLKKYIENDEEIRKYFAAFHLHDSFPAAVLIDDFGGFFDERTCQDRYRNPRGKSFAMVRTLALSRDAIDHAK